MKTTKPTKRGGKRENAGRKAGKRRKRCTVDMLPDTWAAIDQRRGKLSRGRFIESVIEKAHDANNQNHTRSS